MNIFIVFFDNNSNCFGNSTVAGIRIICLLKFSCWVWIKSFTDEEYNGRSMVDNSRRIRYETALMISSLTLLLSVLETKLEPPVVVIEASPYLSINLM